jgi:hypothetical protein
VLLTWLLLEPPGRLLTTGHRSALAALRRLDMDTIDRDGIDGHHKLPPGLGHSSAPMLSPTTTYTGPPPPYSCPSSATPSNPGAFEYISPPSSRRTTVDDKASGTRQSLPSIQEALGGDGTKPFSASSMVHPLPPSSRMTQPTLSFGSGQSVPEAPSGPPNPFSQGPVSGQTADNDAFSTNSAKPQDLRPEQGTIRSTFPAINNAEPILGAPHSMEAKSPISKSTHPAPNSYNHSPHSNTYHPTDDASTRFPPYRSPYAYSAPPSNPPPSAYPSAPDYSRFNPAFKFDDKKSAIPRSHPVQPYSDSVKRHLDIFDVELALNEVCTIPTKEEFSLTGYIDRGRLWSSARVFSHLESTGPPTAKIGAAFRQSPKFVRARRVDAPIRKGCRCAWPHQRSRHRATACTCR